jgi:hypothetical protein
MLHCIVAERTWGYEETWAAKPVGCSQGAIEADVRSLIHSTRILVDIA